MGVTGATPIGVAGLILAYDIHTDAEVRAVNGLKSARTYDNLALARLGRDTSSDFLAYLQKAILYPNVFSCILCHKIPLHLIIHRAGIPPVFTD